MKNVIRTAFAVFALSVAGYASAAQEVDRSEALSLMKVGVVSTGNAYTLDQLNRSLAMKASDAGATGYRITSVRGNNLLSATATLYR
ncbi:DUF1471 domain-containing protein [Buttiauxella sp. B2]|uniref:YdgH/BhsA/McbA-like domain containing protein n=1 Tax=Buttiauxella sp. B2 TaxID=2587812 RepID=UPI0011215667|nr:YdgH/BhsA/McbA-like domain containing protein [Buttiauxella sp. B2]TNV12482.1 DUF1471 domain-containing protein [Buttiauxella sp. B2]